MTIIKTAFWNLQNLFDTVPSDIAADLGFTPAQGWTQPVFQQKINNLAEVIRLMFDGDMPDLFGVCEVETEALVQQLANLTGRTDYRVAHVESPDIRGIDVSLIYSEDIFELAGEPVGHLIHLRYPTRDVFQVPLTVKENGSLLHVFVNHWPSRSRGQFESEPFRLTVASRCGRLVDDILKFSRAGYFLLPDAPESLAAINQRWNGNVLLMGDFNDEPFNRSLLHYLQASSGTDHLEEEIKKSSGSNLPSAKAYLRKQAYLFNCMWPLMGEPDTGTFYWPESTNTMNMLDHFTVSRGLFYGHSGLQLDRSTVSIFTPDIMSTSGKGRPKAFKFNKDGQVVVNGYSDHFPILTHIDVL